MHASVLVLTLLAALAAALPSGGELHPGFRREVIASHDNRPHFTIPPREAVHNRQRRSSNFEVSFVGNFPTQTAAAFAYAVDVWDTYLDLKQPIRIQATWEPLGSNVLGSAGPKWIYRNFCTSSACSSVARSGVYYPSALASQLDDRDLTPGDFHIEASFSSSFSAWYFGTDGVVPSNRWDFVSVVLHEIGHGLGFIGGLSRENGVGVIYFQMIFDKFISEQPEADDYIVDKYSSNSVALGNALVNNLYFYGPLTDQFNIKLYTPSQYSSGSSTYHLDPNSVLPEDALMTPSIGPQDVQHDPGRINLCLLAELGWDVNEDCSVSDDTPRLAAGSASVTSTFATIGYTSPFSSPFSAPPVVIVGQPNVPRNTQPFGAVRVGTVSATNFQVRFQPWAYLGSPTFNPLSVSYIAAPAGHHTINGLELEALQIQASSSGTRFSFTTAFPSTPIVLCTVASSNNPNAVAVRVHSTDASAFSALLQSTPGTIVPETVNCIAFAAGTGAVESLGTYLGQFVSSVTHDNKAVALSETTGSCFIAGMQTFVGVDLSVTGAHRASSSSVNLYVQEEQSTDNELNHAGETIGLVSFTCGSGTTTTTSATTTTTVTTTTTTVTTTTTTVTTTTTTVTTTTTTVTTTTTTPVTTTTTTTSATGGSKLVMQTVTISGSASSPVAFGSSFGTAPCVVAQAHTGTASTVVGDVRIGAVSATGFNVQFELLEYLISGPATLPLTFAAVPFGRGSSGGLVWEALTAVVPSFTGTRSNPISVSFSQAFTSVPAIICSLASANDASPLFLRLSSVSATGFAIRGQREGNLRGHAAETANCIAFATSPTLVSTPSAGQVELLSSSVSDTPATVAFSIQARCVLAQMQTFVGTDSAVLGVAPFSGAVGSVSVAVVEDQLADTETFHADEVIAVVAGECAPTSSQLSVTGNQVAVGVGAQTTSAFVGGSFASAPIVVASPVHLSSSDTYYGTVRVKSATTTGVTLALDKMPYLTGSFSGTRIVSYLAAPAGHGVRSGVEMEALTVSLPGFTGRSGDTVDVSFATPFSSPPVVVCSVASSNDASSVAVRVSGVTSSTFSARLQVQESGPGHAAETANCIAVATGSASSSSLGPVTSKIIPEVSSVSLFDSSLGAGRCVVGDLQSMFSTESATLGFSQPSSDGGLVFVREDKSLDAEVVHRSEVVGVVAFACPSA